MEVACYKKDRYAYAYFVPLQIYKKYILFFNKEYWRIFVSEMLIVMAVLSSAFLCL